MGRPQADARNRQESPVRRTAPWSPPMARPWCSPPPSARTPPNPDIDFFPLTVNYQEKYFAAGKIPGGYFKREARADGARDADLAPDRPPDPSAFRRRLSQRNAGHRHRSQPRHGKRSRHRGAGGGVGGADHFRHPVHGTDRGCARRLHRRRICSQSADRRHAEVQARSRRRRHGRRGADGRIRSPGTVRTGHAGRRDVRPPRNADRDRRHHPPGGKGRERAARSAGDETAPLAAKVKAFCRKRTARRLPDRRKSARAATRSPRSRRK